MAGVEGAVESEEKVSENSILRLRDNLGLNSLLSGLYLVSMPGSQSLKASAENVMLNNFWDRKHPFLTPSRTRAIMELADDCDERAWAAEYCHDFPESAPNNCMEGLAQVNEGRGRSRCCSMPFYLKLEVATIMLVPRPALKPHWLSGSG